MKSTELIKRSDADILPIKTGVPYTKEVLWDYIKENENQKKEDVFIDKGEKTSYLCHLSLETFSLCFLLNASKLKETDKIIVTLDGNRLSIKEIEGDSNGSM